MKGYDNNQKSLKFLSLSPLAIT